MAAVSSPAFIFRVGTWGDRDKSRGANYKMQLYIYIYPGALYYDPTMGPFTCSAVSSLPTILGPPRVTDNKRYVTSTPRKYKGPKQWENFQGCKGCLATGAWCSATVAIPSCPVPAIYSAGLASVSLAGAAVY